MPTPTLLKARLREQALRLGFSLFGVASTDPLEDDYDRLRSWIAAGHADAMPYLARSPERRADPALHIENARSVVMLGMSYAQHPPDIAALSGLPEGRVARFALHRDYHQVLRPRLENLARFLSETASAESLFFVDTGPFLERAFARRAGLGFIGKNNCLIHPTFGSWFVLGSLITTAELPPDSPMENQCGDCRLCMKACPGGALIAPYCLDPRRCLSWETIEARKTLPPERMEQLGTCLFGCDACQEVCPFNRSPLPCRERDLSAPTTMSFSPEQDADPSPRMENLHLAGWNALLGLVLRIPSRRVFQRVFSGSPLLRPGRNGLLRNAAIVAGNLGRHDLVPALEVLAKNGKDPELLRISAQWALERLRRSL